MSIHPPPPVGGDVAVASVFDVFRVPCGPVGFLSLFALLRLNQEVSWPCGLEV